MVYKRELHEAEGLWNRQGLESWKLLFLLGPEVITEFEKNIFNFNFKFSPAL